MGTCNNTSVVMVIGRDRRLKYLHSGPIRGAELEKVVGLISTLVAESEAAAPRDAGQ